MTVEVVRFTVRGEERPAIGEKSGRHWVVVYDGACKLCGKAVKLLRSWDRNDQLEILPFQAPGVQARFPWIPVNAFREAVQLIGSGGETFQGEAAIEQLLTILPKGKWLGWIFDVPLVRPLADQIYRWVARNRYRLGCGQHCQYRALAVDFGEASRRD